MLVAEAAVRPLNIELLQLDFLSVFHYNSLIIQRIKNHIIRRLSENSNLFGHDKESGKMASSDSLLVQNPKLPHRS